MKLLKADDIIGFSKLLIALGIIVGSFVTLAKAAGYDLVFQSEYKPHVLSQDKRNCVSDIDTYNKLLVLVMRLEKEKQPIPPEFTLQLAQLKEAIKICAQIKA